MANIKESDLFLPVKNHFETLGYQVKGEIKNCDVVATNLNELIIIELKLHLNLEVILQAIERQKITPSVYIATPALKYQNITQKQEKIHYLLKKLELGLIYITKNNIAQVIFTPQKYNDKSNLIQNLDLIQKILHEFNSRESSNNQGGSVKVEIMTTYKEEAIKIAKLIRAYTQLTLAQLRQYGTAPGTYSILSNNYNGWFVKSKFGYYRLSKDGQDYLKELDLKQNPVIYD